MLHNKLEVRKRIFLMSMLLFTVISHNVEGQKAISDVRLKVQKILSNYDSQSLNKEYALAIHEAFRDAGIRGGPKLDEIIKSNGFNPEILRILAPPPEEHDERRKENQNFSGIVFSSLEKNFGPDDFTLFSSAVGDDGELLRQYKCEPKINGIEKSIPLHWKNVPDGAKSLAIVMYHYPNTDDHSQVNSYLLLWGIDPSVNEIPYGMADQGEWYMGSNKDGNTISYTSPCSHSLGSHKYTIVLFALSETPTELPVYSTSDINFESFMSAVENTTTIGKAELNFIDKSE